MKIRIVGRVLVVLACSMSASPVRALEGRFYVLDGFGGVHAGNGAPTISPATPYFGFDVAQDIEFFQAQGTVSAGILVLDKFGGVHRGGGLQSQPISPMTPYFGFNIARAIVARDTKPRIMGAYVSSTGVTSGGIDLQSVVRENTGQYLLTFDRSAFFCVWSVTLGAPANQSFAGHVPMQGQTSASLATGGTLRVSTMNSSGTLADRAFHVMVACPQS